MKVSWVLPSRSSDKVTVVTPYLVPDDGLLQALASRAGAADTALCLMCAEKEPLDCHRTVLVSRRLAERGVEIEHLLADGRSEPHGALEDRLMAGDKAGAPDLFTRPLDRATRLAGAYAARERAMKRT